MIGEIIAKNISTLRKQKGLTQAELAAHIHYSDKVISKWERGESMPDIEALAVLAGFYGVSLDNITKDAGLTQHTVIDNIDNSETNDTAENIQHDKEAQESNQKLNPKNLILRGARIASLVILPMLINILYLIQDELLTIEFLSSGFYFLSVIPAVLLANLIISLAAKRAFSSTEVLFLFFAFVWTAGIVIIYTMWHMEIIAPGSQRMRIWYILLFYNVIIATIIVITCLSIKKFAKKEKGGLAANQNDI